MRDFGNNGLIALAISAAERNSTNAVNGLTMMLSMKSSMRVT